MPKVDRQKPTGNSHMPTARPTTLKSSVSDEFDDIIPIEQLDDDYIKFCVYGPNRVGKSTLACLFPKPLLLVSLEPNNTGGAKSIKKMAGVLNKRYDSSEAAVRLAVALAECDLQSDKWPGRLKTVVVDSATSLQDIVLKEIMNLSKVPEMLSWGMVSEDGYRQRSEKTRECLRPFLNLPCHVVVTAKERDHNAVKGDRRPSMVRGQTDNSCFGADLGGATAGWLHDACDYLGYLYIAKETKVVASEGLDGDTQETEIETGRVVRRLRTMYHPNILAGFRSCTPEAVPEWIESPTYDSIWQVIQGKKISNGKYP